MTGIDSNDDNLPAYEPSGNPTEPPLEISIVGHPDGKEFLITLTPPKQPQSAEDLAVPGSRAPVDIVLVIDVSASMDADAPAPGEKGKYHLCLTCME